MKRALSVLTLPILLAGLALCQTTPPRQVDQYTAPVPPYPTSFTCGTVGTAGTTSYYYWIVAIHPAGHVPSPAPYQIVNANSILDGSNYVTCTWNNPAPAGISMTYALLRSTTPSFPGVSGSAQTVAVTASTSSVTANDQSNTLNSYTFSPAAPANARVMLDNQTASTPIYSLLDANANHSLDVVQTAAGVNGVKITAGATGTGPTIAPSTGSDTNTAITLQSKGTGAVNLSPGSAAGTVVFGGAAGSGNITLGSSSVAQSVLIANGAGAPTVSVANASTAGATVNVAGAATATGNTDTVNIATGNTAGTGAKAVHIADGTPAGTGTNTVTIGSNANTANVTAIQGGNGTGAITLTPQTTGTIVIGAAAGSGAITLGSSSVAETVNIGTGAGASTVAVANGGTAGNTVTIANAATGGGNTDTVSIATGNAAATGIKVVNILTGTPGTSGNNRATIGGGSTSKATVNAAATSYQQWNFISSETGGNNALVASLTDASGNNVTVAAGLCVLLKSAHTTQAGANTFNLNSHGTDAMKKASAPGTDLAVTNSNGSLIGMCFDGTVWQVQGQ